MKTLPFIVTLLMEVKKTQLVTFGFEFVLASPVSTHMAASGEYLQNLSQKIGKSNLEKQNERLELDT